MELEGSWFCTEPKDCSVAFDVVPQSAEMDMKLECGGLKPGEYGLDQDLFMRQIVWVAF